MSNQIVGNSSSSLFEVFTFFFFACFPLISSASFLSSSLESSRETLKKSSSLSRNYLSFPSIYSAVDGGKSFRDSNMFWTLKGIKNLSSGLASCCWFFFFCFLPFLSVSYSSSLDFLDWRIYSPFYFFHWESEANFAVNSAGLIFSSFFSSTLVLSLLKPFR